MAAVNWKLEWVPQNVATFGSEWRTLVSKFESGKEQRRKKRSRKKHSFILSFDRGISDTVVDEIRVFFDSKYGQYTQFYFPNFMQSMKGTRLACVDGGVGADTLTDTETEFVKKGFNTDLYVDIGGSLAGNGGIYQLDGVAAGTLTIPTGSLTANESDSNILRFYCTYEVRFNEDYFRNNFLYKTIGQIRTIELIEVI